MQRTHQGFSLIELMLALGLGLIVTWGIVQLFVGNSQTMSTLTGQSRLQENARYALDFISRSARAAGFFGCAPYVYDTKLNGSFAQTYEFDISNPVDAFNGGATNDPTAWTPSATVLPREAGANTLNALNDGTGIDFSTVEPGTDIVVFRRLEDIEQIAGDVAPDADPVLEDDGDVSFVAGDFVAIADCKYATVFRVTGVVDSGATITLARATGGGGVYENSADLSLGAHFGDVLGLQGTSVGRVVTDIYYIAEGAGTNNRGDTPLSLWRRSGTTAPVELVEGVEDLQVLFGVDTNLTSADPSDAPNTYMALDAMDPNNNAIRTVRLEVTVNSVDVLPGETTPSSRTYSQTISLRN